MGSLYGVPEEEKGVIDAQVRSAVDEERLGDALDYLKIHAFNGNITRAAVALESFVLSIVEEMKALNGNQDPSETQDE